MNQLPPGSKILLFQDANGNCQQTGWARMTNGKTCACGTIANWRAQAPAAYSRSTYALLSPNAMSQMLAQQAQGGGGIGNTFTRVDLPNQGAVGVARKQGNASPAAGNEVFALVLNNSAGATAARQIIGDYTGTYVLLGNPEVSPAGFVIGGSWTTNSKTQFAGRTAFRPWSVVKIQMIASDETFFNLTNSFYFDTTPSNNGPIKDSLSLTGLLSADQFNPKIQWYERKVRFDGINGLDITVPAGMTVTLQFFIESEGSAGDQVLLN